MYFWSFIAGIIFCAGAFALLDWLYEKYVEDLILAFIVKFNEEEESEWEVAPKRRDAKGACRKCGNIVSFDDMDKNCPQCGGSFFVGVDG
jgi:rubrerythrin